MAYRATPHETTQTSPNSLMFGREVYSPDIMIGKASKMFDASLSLPCYIEEKRLKHRI